VGRRDTGEGRDADGGAGLLHGLEHSGRGASVSARDSRENRDTERQEARTGPDAEEHERSEQALEIASDGVAFEIQSVATPSVNSPNRSIGRAPNRLTSRGVMRELAKIRPVMGKKRIPLQWR